MRVYFRALAITCGEVVLSYWIWFAFVVDCSSDEEGRFLSGADVSPDFSLQSFSSAESTNSMRSASCVAFGGFVMMQVEVLLRKC